MRKTPKVSFSYFLIMITYGNLQPTSVTAFSSSSSISNLVIKRKRRNVNFNTSSDPLSVPYRRKKCSLGVSLMDEDTIESKVKKSYFMDELNLDEDAVTIKSNSNFMESFKEKVGVIDPERLAFPEISSGEVPRVFSNISYKKTASTPNGEHYSSAIHDPGSTFSAASLIAGTTIGAGVLALPIATAPAGLIPSSTALCAAWLYMVISGLLIAELSINRIGETGRPGVGILELYKNSLGRNMGLVGSGAYFFLHYAIMVAYLAQGGSNLGAILETTGVHLSSYFPGLEQILFATITGSLVYFAKPAVVEKFNNVLVAGVLGSFAAIMFIGAGSADFSSLLAPENQHPEMVVNAFPILFLSLVYQNVVPTVVTQLEGDRKKITSAIFGGTLAPLVMFLGWNAVILGNVIGMPEMMNGNFDPIASLEGKEGVSPTLSYLVDAFSELAITTSLIGFIYGLLDGITDLADIPLKGPKFEKWKPALFAAVLMPPLTLSLGNPDIFYQALDTAGAFGVSTLFLVLPPIMVWQARYGESNKTITTPPMVPFGKIPLGGLWKAAGTLIIEQGAEKLGIIQYISEHLGFLKS